MQGEHLKSFTKDKKTLLLDRLKNALPDTG